MRSDMDSSRNDPAASDRQRDGPDASPKVRLFLVEDSPLLQELLSGVLGEIEGVELCGCSDNETEALDRLAETPADIVVIDIQLREGSGIGILDALRKDAARYGHPRKVVLTNYAHATMRRRCADAGMDAFFDKSLHISQLISYVTGVAEEKLAGR